MESESYSSLWCSWCRLCAKEDSENSINILSNNRHSSCSTDKETRMTLQEALEKYFWVQSSIEDVLPNVLCTDCFSLVSSIINFNERVERVQQMYNYLLETPPLLNHHDLKSIRLRFNVSDNDRINWFSHSTISENLSDESTNLNCAKKLFTIHIKQEQIGTDSCHAGNETFGEENSVSNKNCVDLEEIMCGPQTQTDSNEEGDPFDILSDNYGNSYVQSEDEGDNGLQTKGNDAINKSESPDRNATEKSCVTLDSREHRLNKRRKRIKPKGRESKKTEVVGADFPLNGKCKECGENFDLYSTCCEHMKQKHGDTSENKQWKCPVVLCDRVLQSWYNFERHIRSIHMPVEERKKKKCPECDSRFTSKAQLDAHVNYKHHVNYKPFVCEECGLCLRTKSNLTQHLIIHKEEKPFGCEVCKKKFKNNYRLKIHMDTHSPNKHVCAICGLQLNSRATLNRHFLVHSDDTKHNCDYCGRAFKRAKALKNHLLLHTGLKPYSCEFCDRTFANGSNCRSHMKKLHPEDLAALEASGNKTHAKNIPKLETLKAVTKAADNLTPVVTKFSGCFAFGKKPKTYTESDKSKTVMSPHTSLHITNNSVKTSNSETTPLAGIVKSPSTTSASNYNPAPMACPSPTSIPNFDNIYQHLIMKHNPSEELPTKRPRSSLSSPTSLTPRQKSLFNEFPESEVENALTAEQQNRDLNM